MEKYIEEIRNIITEINHDYNVYLYTEIRDDNTISILCDITQKVRNIFGMEIVEYAKQHVCDIYTEFAKFDDHYISNEIESVIEYADGEYSDKKINLEYGTVDVIFKDNHEVCFSCSEWGTIESK